MVDSASIEVNRRRRRAKSEGLDVHKLPSMLMHDQHGERQVWQVVKVPSIEAEDQRHLELNKDQYCLKKRTKLFVQQQWRAVGCYGLGGLRTKH